MFFYARSDTHFLLYIYDCMRNELVEKTNSSVPEENRIEIVLQKSKEVSLIRFERQVYNAETGKGSGGWFPMITKTPSLYNNEQFAVFRAVHEWRDTVARLDDDSPHFVMSNVSLTNVARDMPQDLVALLSTLTRPVSHGVKSRMNELLDLIVSAKAVGKSGLSMMEVLRPAKPNSPASANTPAAAVDPSPKLLLAVDGNAELQKSAFWGGAFGSSVWDGPTTPKANANIAFSFPGLEPSYDPLNSTQSSALADRSRQQEEIVVVAPAGMFPITPSVNTSIYYLA